MAAHREIRSRLNYEVPVIVAQKERKSQQNRPRQQPQPLLLQQQPQQQQQLQQQFESLTIDSKSQPPSPPPTSSSHLHFTSVSPAPRPELGGDGNSDTCFDAYRGSTSDDHVAFHRAAACAEVQAADAAAAAARKQWGKTWVAAALVAEKGEVAFCALLFGV